MAQFTIRVELHEASREDYSTLATNLARLGITDIITCDDGVQYHMPPAEYTYTGYATRADVLKAVKEVAAGLVRNYGVLVTESAGRTWILTRA